MTIDGSYQFENNHAHQNGGAVASEGTLTITGTNTFVNNTAGTDTDGADGGAIYAAGNTTISGTNIFRGNTASGSRQGGAIRINNGILTLAGENHFIGNKAAIGGAISVRYGKIHLTGKSTFEGNSAIYGGAIVTDYHNGCEIILSGNHLFQDNTSEVGGAIYVRGPLTLEGDETVITFSGNRDSSGANDIYLEAREYQGTYTYATMAIQDSGTYSFDGGIRGGGAGNAVAIQDAKVTFERGSVTDVGIFTIDNATVTFQEGSRLDVTSKELAVRNSTFIMNGTVAEEVALKVEGSSRISGRGASQLKVSSLTVADGDSTLLRSGTYPVDTLSMTGGSLTLQGAAKLNATSATLSGGTLNFRATPEGFGTLSIPTENAFSSSVTVGIAGFTLLSANDSTTIIDGVALSSVTDATGLLTVATGENKTTVAIKSGDLAGYGNSLGAVQNIVSSETDGGEVVVGDFSLLVETTDIQGFAQWLEEETDLETIVGSGHVNVRLNQPLGLSAEDWLAWDFRNLEYHAVLRDVKVNRMNEFVPEPSTYLMMGLGLGWLGLMNWYRRQKNRSNV